MITFSDNIARKPYLGSTEIAEVWLGNVLIYPENTVDYSRQYLTFEVVEGGTIEFVAVNASVSKTISYSLDNGETWTDLTSSTSYQSMGGTLSPGDKVLVKGTNNTYASNDRSYYNHFASTAKINVYGNIMSLITGDNFVDNKTLTEINTFYRLFGDNSKLLSAKHLILPATTLTQYCYAHMFASCANFTSAPKLTATTLADGCYYQMFAFCSSLTTAPELPATTLAERCYGGMFIFCSNLNYIKAMFTTTPSATYTSNWVNGVASSGTFVKNSAATWNVSGNNGIPSGWTVQNY